MTMMGELRLLAGSWLTGVCLMAAYDVLRFFRMLVPHSTWWTGLEDLFYWAFSSFSTFLLLFCQNDGILRWYAVAGVLLGMIIYNRTISRIFWYLLKKLEKYFTIKISTLMKRSDRGRKRREEKMGDDARCGRMEESRGKSSKKRN